MFFVFFENKDYSYRCLWMTWSGGKKQNMVPMWKKLMQNVDLDEPTSFLDHVYLGCTQRERKLNEIIIVGSTAQHCRPRLRFCWRPWGLKINLGRNLMYFRKSNSAPLFGCARNKRQRFTVLQNPKLFRWMLVWATCWKIRPILTRETNCLHDLRAFSCNRSLWSSTRTLRFVQYTLTEWRRPRFRRSMGPSSIISERNAFRCDPGGFFKSKLQDSDQLQTLLALYDQETVRNNGQPSYSRLKTSVRLDIDQTMTTRNFRVRNEVVERGAETNSQKGKKAHVEREVGECYQWKATGQCSKGDSCSFSHEWATGNSGGIHRQKAQSSSPAPDSKAKTDGEWEKTLKRFRQQRWKLFRQKGEHSVSIQKL